MPLRGPCRRAAPREHRERSSPKRRTSRSGARLVDVGLAVVVVATTARRQRHQVRPAHSGQRILFHGSPPSRATSLLIPDAPPPQHFITETSLPGSRGGRSSAHPVDAGPTAALVATNVTAWYHSRHRAPGELRSPSHALRPRAPSYRSTGARRSEVGAVGKHPGGHDSRQCLFAGVRRSSLRCLQLVGRQKNAFGAHHVARLADWRRFV